MFMIKIKNLTKIYKSKKKNNCTALDNISFDLPDKGLVFIIGKSGSGKSTLLNLLGGLDSKTSGEISVYGNNISNYSDKKLIAYRSSMVGFVFQDFHLLDDLTVEENIGVSLKLHDNYNKEQIKEVLKKVDLEGYGNRYPNELSGGQKQRVAIARALVKNPNLILADEPTGNLDSNTTKQIIELIKEISKEKLVIIVSHNLFDAYEYADRIIELSEGRILNDLVLNEDYSNDIKIVDNKLILPLLKRFNEEELDIVLKECRTNKIEKIVQDNSKYIKYSYKEYEDKKIQIKKSKLSIKDTFKFSYLFGKKRFIRFVLSAMMASMLMVVLTLSQSIAYFDDAKIIQEELSSNSSLYSIRKNIDSTVGEAYLKEINDEDIKMFENENISNYKLYNDCIYFIGGSTQTVTYNMVPSVSLGKLFVGSTFGTIETTEEYTKKILNVDELNIYTNNITYMDSGIYITDFVADSMVACGFSKDYNDVLGEIYETQSYLWGYINGIIITDYKVKYESIINEIKSTSNTDDLSEEMLDFYDYITQVLAMGFTFEENYKENVINNPTKSWGWTFGFTVNNVNVVDKVRHISKGSFFNNKLNGNEILMHFNVYNSIYNTEYNQFNYSSFEPHNAIIKIFDNYDNLVIEKEVKIVGVSNLAGSNIHVSDEFFAEYKEKSIFTYGLYFDGDNISEIIDIAIENDYVMNSLKMSAVQTMTKAVSVFNSFFDLLVFILITACIFILISFGVKNIKSNIYEIGVLKALGCKFKNFVIMFILHTLIIVMLIVLFSYCGYYVFSDLANKILVESLKKLAPSYIVIDLKFITFNYVLMFYNSVIVFVISILSTLIPISILKKIEPISIIKAKE